MNQIDQRLSELGISVPDAAAPVANYLAFVKTSNLISISGQIPIHDGKIQYQGIIGDNIDLVTACDAARLCAINLVAQMKRALDGDLSRVTRVVKLGGFVRCTSEFTDQPKVINAASDLMVDIFGDAGRHSRSAVGTNALPLGVPVEIDALVEFR